MDDGASDGEILDIVDDIDADEDETDGRIGSLSLS